MELGPLVASGRTRDRSCQEPCSDCDRQVEQPREYHRSERVLVGPHGRRPGDVPLELDIRKGGVVRSARESVQLLAQIGLEHRLPLEASDF